MRVVHVLWECPDCTGTLICTATAAIEHIVSLPGNMYNLCGLLCFFPHVCHNYASMLSPDINSALLPCFLPPFLSLPLSFLPFYLSHFHKHRLVHHHYKHLTWQCTLAQYLYMYVYIHILLYRQYRDACLCTQPMHAQVREGIVCMAETCHRVQG